MKSEDLQLGWRLKFLLCTDPLRYHLVLNVLVHSNKLTGFIWKHGWSCWAFPKCDLWAAFGRSREEPGWVLELRAQGGLGSGGNISSQMLNRAPGSMAGWLLSVSNQDRGTDLLLSSAAALDWRPVGSCRGISRLEINRSRLFFAFGCWIAVWFQGS